MRKSVTQDFILVGQTTGASTPFFVDEEINERAEEDGALVGFLLVVPRDSDRSSKRERRAYLRELDDAIDDVLAVANELPPTNSGLVNSLPTFIEERTRIAQASVVVHAARFALFRTGELRIWFDSDLFTGRDTVIEPLTDAERLAAEFLPSQMYFFVKDTTHQHYHHDPETDQLLKLERVDASATPLDDAAWRIETLRGLAKVVVEYRHSNHPLSNKKALGILAYADAFQSLLARIGRQRDINQVMETLESVILYDFAHVRSSIEALDALNETRRGALLQLFGILVGVVLSAFALWSGAVQIQAPLCDAMKGTETPCPKMEPNTAVDVVNWVVANPLGFVAFLAVAGFVAFIMFFKGFASIPGARRIMTWVGRFSSAVAASTSQVLGGSDYIGQAIRLIIIGSLSLASACLGYWIVPKHEVPTIAEQNGRDIGAWASLDHMVDKKPAESGLLTDSVIARELRDLTGNDYGEFLSLMAEASPLQRSQVLWLTGTPAGSTGRSGAYLIIDQKLRKLEVGLRRNGDTTVYRTPGAVLAKPSAIAKAFDGIMGDVSPLAVQAPQCRSESVGTENRTLIFSGMIPAVDHCEYKIPLRAGQTISYSPASGKGLQLLISYPKTASFIVEKSFTATKDGVYIVQVRWEPVATSVKQSRVLRPFYLRAKIQ